MLYSSKVKADIDKLMKAVKRLGVQGKWYLTTSGAIREVNSDRCPVSFVADARGIRCGLAETYAPCVEMGISDEARRILIDAADNVARSACRRRVRARLLKAVGL